jgi:hypothetical protein
MDIRPEIDANGMRRANSCPSCTTVDYFLEGDVQSSAYSCEQILEHIEAVREGSVDKWESTGNAHTLILTASCAYIENEFAEDNVTTLDLDELQRIIEKWRDFACR